MVAERPTIIPEPRIEPIPAAAANGRYSAALTILKSEWFSCKITGSQIIIALLAVMTRVLVFKGQNWYGKITQVIVKGRSC